MNNKIFLTLFLILLVSCVMQEELSAQYQIRGWVFGGGSGDAINENYMVRNTFGQTMTGSIHNETHKLYSGFWYLARTSVVTTVNDHDGVLPEQYTLEQNYPNPFNPVTVIVFSLPEQTHVDLRVYDLLGREVRELVNDVKPAGTHTVEFDARSLPSGVFFYRINTPAFVETKRMMLLR